MESSPTDESLMLDYARGDMGAFETLYARHRSGLFRFLMGNVRNQATAEELFQDIWQRVVGARDRYRPDARFSTNIKNAINNAAPISPPSAKASRTML